MPKKAAFILIAALLIPLVCSAQVELSLRSSRENIFLGESFHITLSINGADENIESPLFDASPPAEITLVDSRSNNRSSIQIINGKVTRDVFRGRELTYSIKPKEAGLYRTGAITVKIGGRTYRHEGTAVQVKGVEKQDTVIVSVKASSTSVLVEEPFDITLEIAVKELPDPYWKHNEPLHADALPHITANFLEITEEKDNLIRPDLNSILNAMIDQSGRKPAFRINNYVSRSMGFGSLFDGDPFRERPLRFLFEQGQTTINGIRYRRYSLRLRYTAKAEGEHTFGPVTFKGQVITDVSPDRQARMSEIYTIGPAVTIRVTPPPDAGRPEEFIGSVGRNIHVSAQLDTNVCKVGDPLTLTLEITGDISVSNMRTPLLNLQPELTENFRIYDENVKTDTLPNGKRFFYRVRPTTAGTLEFPPIRIAYFDSAERAYKTVLTAALPLQAEYTAQVSTGNEGAGGVVEVKMALPQPCGITLSDAGMSRESFMPASGTVIILSATAPLLTLFALLMPGLTRLKRSFVANRRHAGATQRCIRFIGRASDAAQLSQALRSWFTLRLDTSGQSLTEREISAVLAGNGVAPDICREMAEIIAMLDERLYKPDATGTLPKERCIQILRRIENSLDSEPSGQEEAL